MKETNWIKAPIDTGAAPSCFCRRIPLREGLLRAELQVTAVGIFEARLDGVKLGHDVLAPGYTAYDKRLQYYTYDVTSAIHNDSLLEIAAGTGWAIGPFTYNMVQGLYHPNYAVNATLTLTYADGTEVLHTDESWQVYTSHVTFAGIYMGETVDYTAPIKLLGNAARDTAAAKFPLIPKEGEDVVENERIAPASLLVTPAGERVIDFGQNMTGYVELRRCGKPGERIRLSFGEVLDKDGNFYNANYRGALNDVLYVCDGTPRIFKPTFSFQGFRYVRLDEYPEDAVALDEFRAIAVHSALKRTGRFSCGNQKINQLYHNTLWGQKSNYLDLPTDCPQRNERLGWTGDAQVFCRTAAYNFDVKKFFKKWLGDMRAEQRDDGAIEGTVPSKPNKSRISAAWGDAATIIPWQLYLAYGDKTLLRENFDMMKKWVDFIHGSGKEEFLWLEGNHYGDWLAMDGDTDSYAGATSTDLIATAFFAYSTELVIKAGEVLGEDVTAYRSLYESVVRAFRSYFMENGYPREQLPRTVVLPEGKTPTDVLCRGNTQTALLLILHFGLCTEAERPKLLARLYELIAAFDGKMTTGFVGTPYLLHVLSDAGRLDLCYQLLLEERNPSWLYSVTHGATTMWEHWNSQKEDGSFWSTEMNSFNHYAYGAVCDWLYGVAAGISPVETAPGYKKIKLAPHPNRALGFVNCSLETAYGRIESNWYYKGEEIYYEFTVPAGCEATLTLPNGYTETLQGGSYHFTTTAV